MAPSRAGVGGMGARGRFQRGSLGEGYGGYAESRSEEGIWRDSKGIQPGLVFVGVQTGLGVGYVGAQSSSQ